jgi:hypothetical protein
MKLFFEESLFFCQRLRRISNRLLSFGLRIDLRYLMLLGRIGVNFIFSFLFPAVV